MMKEVDRIKAAERRRRELEERLLKRMVESEGRLQEAKAEEVCRFFSGQCQSANSKTVRQAHAAWFDPTPLTFLTRSALRTSARGASTHGNLSSPPSEADRARYWRASKSPAFVTRSECE